jgi:hypothetical protein
MHKKGGQISEPTNARCGMRKGCGLSPELFNIYVKKVTKKMEENF